MGLRRQAAPVNRLESTPRDPRFLLPLLHRRWKLNRPTVPPILAGGLSAVNRRSRLDGDPVTVERNRYRSPLDSGEKAHGQTDERITVADLLHLVGAGLANLGSGTATFTGSIIPEQIGTHTGKSRGGFRLACEQFNGSVKRRGSDLGTGLCVQGRNGVRSFRQREKRNGLGGDANLASGSGVVGHGLFLVSGNDGRLVSVPGDRQPLGT